MKTKIFKAFTLIELLIVIVIIGILATALIPRVTGMQDRARYARVEKDFRDFRAAVFLAQSNTNKLLKDITGSQSSSFSCRIDSNLQTISNNHNCRIFRIRALRKIEEASGMSSGSLAGLETDPWGAPYLLDENEGETTVNRPGPCDANDMFYSAGPDGLVSGIERNSGFNNITGDNRGINIAPMGCSGGY